MKAEMVWRAWHEAVRRGRHDRLYADTVPWPEKQRYEKRAARRERQARVFEAWLIRFLPRASRALRMVELLSPEVLRRAATSLKSYARICASDGDFTGEAEEMDISTALLRAAEEMER